MHLLMSGAQSQVGAAYGPGAGLEAARPPAAQWRMAASPGKRVTGGGRVRILKRADRGAEASLQLQTLRNMLANCQAIINMLS